MIYTR